MTNDLKEKLRFIAWTAALVLVDLGAFAAVIAAKYRWNDISIPPLLPPVQAVMIGCFIGATCLTAAFFWLQRRFIGRGGRTVWLTFAIAAAVLFAGAVVIRPIGSADNFWDTLMSRGWTVHGRNPYLTNADDLSFDPLFPHVSREWRSYGMTYGPWWVLLTAPPTLLLRDAKVAVLGMKALVWFGYVGAGVLLFLHLRSRKNANSRLFLGAWLLNPAAVFEVANAGHGEGLLILPLSLFVIGLAGRQPRLALPGLVWAALIKIWPVALFPALLGLKTAKRRDWFRGAALAAALGSAFIFFWSGWHIFEPLFRRYEAINPRFFSPGYLLIWKSVDLAGLNAETAATMTTAALNLLFVAVAVVTAVLTARGRLEPVNAARLLLVFFFFVYLNWLMPWYLLALLPFCLPAADENGAKYLILTVFGLAAAGLLAYGLDWGTEVLLLLIMTIGWKSLRGLGYGS